MTCASCHELISDTATFCPYCGGETISGKFQPVSASSSVQSLPENTPSITQPISAVFRAVAPVFTSASKGEPELQAVDRDFNLQQMLPEPAPGLIEGWARRSVYEPLHLEE